ncbi:hypothetical protein Pres01_47580 [Metapseudomonas resinovorans]|uniref:HEAT repeat domain-containing protein n=1 Tax=Metapseudomonas resinovorans TaxID=53412 RepID=UPI000986AFF2|nr:HEAT repeat domain-containing protein [Pseudomonas resinovorans]GLZ88707.1 hypothetical protein Pres01_47580 [Pseudomonas resinovorans]
MRIEHPALPLTKAAFFAALRTGHGRAIQQIENHGSNGLEDKIIEACVTCLSYDPQCEAARAPWLFAIVERAKLNTEVMQAIKAIEHKPSSPKQRDFDQRSAILKELAASGSDDARRLLYSSLARIPETSDVIGADDIVALDGMDGLIYVARQLGRWLQDDPDFWIDDHLCSQFDGEKGLAALEREAAVDPDVASYLAEIRKTCEGFSGSSTRFNTTAYTATEIVAHVKKNPRDRCYWFRQWGAQADNDQREIVFAVLLASEEPEHAKRLFRCFTKTGVPRFESRLLQWIDHPDEELQWAAITALAPITHKELRQAAKRLIADGNIANGIALLVNNFVEGDFSMCAGQLARFEDADETHHLVGQLLDLCEAHPGIEALDCLLYVYEFSPCSTCRKRAVKALTDTNTTPLWVLAESAFDADPETRALVSADRSFT